MRDGDDVNLGLHVSIALIKPMLLQASNEGDVMASRRIWHGASYAREVAARGWVRAH